MKLFSPNVNYQCKQDINKKKLFGVKLMLRKSTVTLTIFVCITWLCVSANAQTSANDRFAVLVKKADSSFNLGDRQSAERYLGEANEVLSQNSGISKTLQGNSKTVQGKLFMESSLDTSLGYFNEALGLASANRSSQAETKLFIALAYYYSGDYKTAQRYLAESKEFFLTNRDNENYAQVLNNEGVIAFMEGDAETANELCGQALSINAEIGNSLNASRNQQNIDFINGRAVTKKGYNYKPVKAEGGGGNSGSGTGVGTGGGGTVILGGGGLY
jgi:tetratricopeptide (TPR) repeat protein